MQPGVTCHAKAIGIISTLQAFGDSITSRYVKRRLPPLWIQQSGRNFWPSSGQEARFPVLEGHTAAQQSAEVALETRGTVQDNVKKLMKEFRIYRWNPDRPDSKPFRQSYHVYLYDCGPMVLDTLQKIKADNDSSLISRRSCREGIYRSYSMNIGGTNTLACLKPIDGDTSKPTIITPLPHLFVIKDLVVDLTSFYHKYQQTWCPKMGESINNHPQTERNSMVCMNAYYVLAAPLHAPNIGGTLKSFLGPADLLHAYRWICDRRDKFTDERLQALTEDERKLSRCRTIKNCTATCPKSLNPADAIHKMKTKHLLSQPMAAVIL